MLHVLSTFCYLYSLAVVISPRCSIDSISEIHLLDLLCLFGLTLSALVACCVWKYWSQYRRPCIRPQHTQPMWLSTWQSILLLQLYPCHYYPVAGFSFATSVTSLLQLFATTFLPLCLVSLFPSRCHSSCHS